MLMPDQPVGQNSCAASSIQLRRRTGGAIGRQRCGRRIGPIEIERVALLGQRLRQAAQGILPPGNQVPPAPSVARQIVSDANVGGWTRSGDR